MVGSTANTALATKMADIAVWRFKILEERWLASKLPVIHQEQGRAYLILQQTDKPVRKSDN